MTGRVEDAIRNAITGGVRKIAAYKRARIRNDEPNPYLTGIHTPMTGEETLTELTVSGEIPPELDGIYARNGPNPVSAPNPASYHWFSGSGMVHGVRLQAGKALWYRNRWVRGANESAALGEPPIPGTRNPDLDSPNTNIVSLGGAIWAIVEAGGMPVRLDDALASVAHDPFGGTLHHAFSAHPHVDPDAGEAHAICYMGTRPDCIWHVVVAPDGRVIREAPIPVDHGPSIHDCMITQSYVIVMDLPVTFSMRTLLAGYSFPYRWNPDHPARIGLMPRSGTASDIIWCPVEPCYIFHPANAYEAEDGQVIFDACVHDSMFTESRRGPASHRTPFERWTINPEARTVVRTVIDPAPQEFPRPNESRIGKPYRFAYCVALPEGGDPGFLNETRLYKHDLIARIRHVHDFGAGQVPGEFVFIPKQGADAEDDGWLMGFVIDTAHETTDLVILDAARFTAPPVARVTIPHRIPPGFHGNWIETARR